MCQKQLFCKGHEKLSQKNPNHTVCLFSKTSPVSCQASQNYKGNGEFSVARRHLTQLWAPTFIILVFFSWKVSQGDNMGNWSVRHLVSHVDTKTESEAETVEKRCPPNSPPHPRKCPCWASACGRCGQQSRHCQVKCSPSVMWQSPASQQPGPWLSGPLHSPGNKGHHLHIQLTTQWDHSFTSQFSSLKRPLPHTTLLSYTHHFPRE